MKKSLIEFYTRLAHGLAVQFGSNCEVVVHDLQGKDIEHSIIAIENGHVTGRRIGDGPSQIVLESLHNSEQNLKQEDKLAYLTKTKNGKILNSSTIFIRDDSDKIIGIFGINYDISLMLAMEKELSSFTGTIEEDTTKEPIAVNIGDVNGDGTADLTDLVMLQKYLVRKGTLIAEQSSRADLNADHVLNVVDAMLLRQLLLKHA